MSRFSWTQPCCDECWQRRQPGREAVRLLAPVREECVDCGAETYSGIYIRLDPKTAAHPTLTND